MLQRLREEQLLALLLLLLAVLRGGGRRADCRRRRLRRPLIPQLLRLLLLRSASGCWRGAVQSGLGWGLLMLVLLHQRLLLRLQRRLLPLQHDEQLRLLVLLL